MQKTSRWFFINIFAGFAFSAALFLGVAWLQIGWPTAGSDWSHQILQRKLAKAAQMREPKLLVVGGSGALFGIKARQIQEALGIPTVNFGIHAGLGPDYLLRQARQSARPGDTVLLVMEYELYEQGNDNLGEWANRNGADYIMAREPQYFRALPLGDQIRLAFMLPFGRVWRGFANKWSGAPASGRQAFSIYDPDSVDEWGDQNGLTAARRPVPPPALATIQTLVKGLSPQGGGFKIIQSFCAWAAANHIRVLAAYPNTSFKKEYELPPAKAAFGTIRQFYARQNIPVLGSPEEAILPPADFLDTCYHLIEEASVQRTDRLVVRLRPFFLKGAALVL